METDLMEFCYKEGMHPYRNSVGYIFETLYRAGKTKTSQELLSIPKLQYLSYAPKNWVRKKKDAKWLWQATNKILRRHGFEMYTHSVIVSYED